MNVVRGIGILLAVVSLAYATSARADIVVSFNDLGSAGVEVIIADNSPAGTMTALGASTHADADATAGMISVPVGLTAGSFLIDPATTVFTLGGGANDALLDLLLLVEATSPGTLEALVTATNLSLDNGAATLTGNLGGFSTPAVGGSSITYQAGFDPGNGQFTFPGGSTVGPVSIGGSTFGTSLTTPVSGSNPFSLSEQVTITAGSGGQIIGFDGAAGADDPLVPEPSSILLWTVAAGVIGVTARKRARSRRSDAETETTS